VLIVAGFVSSEGFVVVEDCPNENPLEGAEDPPAPPIELPKPNPVALAPPNILFSLSFGCKAAPKLN
jgi:hypothetical protein